MKKKSIILIVIAVVLILAGVITLYTNSTVKEKTANKEFTPKDAEKYVKDLGDVIINGGTKKELTDKLQTKEIQDIDIVTGKEMYLLQTPDEEAIKKEKLQNYVETGKKLAKNLEKKIQDNYKLTIEGVADEKDYYGVLVTYQTYCYMAYLNDLHQIQNELLIRKGYNFDDPNFTPPKNYEIDKYKAKIKAAKILDSHLDDYVNTTETDKSYVNFKNKKLKNNSESLLSFLMNIEGYTYDNQGKLMDQELTNSYIGTISDEDPLAI